MAQVKVFFAPREVVLNLLFIAQANAVPIVRERLEQWIPGPVFETPQTGEDAAEEAFDLSNNPSRQDERVEKYGRVQSLSSGDIAEVDGVKYLCMSFGWATL